jgi:hypothetical protein
MQFRRWRITRMGWRQDGPQLIKRVVHSDPVRNS